MVHVQDIRKNSVPLNQKALVLMFQHMATKDSEYAESHREDDKSVKTHDESESLSDIDDLEVVGYLHNEVERNYKKIIWEKINWEYLKEQEAKEAAPAAATSVAKSKKGRKQRRTQEAKSSGPAQSAAEATHQTSKRKRLSSKVNFEIMEKLFDEPAAPVNPKKVRLEPCSDNHDKPEPEPEPEPELEDKNRDNELGSVDEYEDEDDMGGLYENTLYDENVDDRYDYENDDYGYDGY